LRAWHAGVGVSAVRLMSARQRRGAPWSNRPVRAAPGLPWFWFPGPFLSWKPLTGTAGGGNPVRLRGRPDTGLDPRGLPPHRGAPETVIPDALPPWRGIGKGRRPGGAPRGNTGRCGVRSGCLVRCVGPFWSGASRGRGHGTRPPQVTVLAPRAPRTKRARHAFLAVGLSGRRWLRCATRRPGCSHAYRWKAAVAGPSGSSRTWQTVRPSGQSWRALTVARRHAPQENTLKAGGAEQPIGPGWR
jgi:hypothetical protein